MIFIRKLWNSKTVLFSVKYLLYTNTALGAIILTAADICEQRVEYKFRQIYLNDLTFYKHDMQRTKANLLAGTGFGILGHYWYFFLDTKFPGYTINVIKKKLMCEILASPIFAAWFFFSIGKAEGKTFEFCLCNFKLNILYVSLVDLFAYIPLQFLNFYYLHPKYRFLCVAIITFFYDIFLSFVTHRFNK